MAEVIAKGLKLSDSGFKTRPDTKIFHYMDGNAGLNNVQEENRKKVLNHLKFPIEKESNEHFIKTCSVEPAKFPSSGEYRAPAPLRDYENITEPVSGFISAGYDIDRQTGQSKVRSYSSKSETPQGVAPSSINSIRKWMPAAYPETQRLTENDPPAPEKWNSRIRTARQIRADLGGWTNKELPKRHILSNAFAQPNRVQSAPMTDREKLAYHYVYTSTTQSAMEEIPFDTTLVPKLWPPPATLERCADPLSRKSFLQTHLPPSQGWRRPDGTWEKDQIRKDYYSQQRPHTFIAPGRRTDQIPGYSGIGGSEDPVEVDNPHYNPYKSFTHVRTPMPKFAFSSAGLNIPGYTGCTPSWPRPFEDIKPRIDQRPMSTYTDDYRRLSPLGRMVSMVKPHNSFHASAAAEAVPSS